LPIGNRRDDSIPTVVGSRAGVDSCWTTFPHIIRKAESAYLVAIDDALSVHITDISIAGLGRVAELKTDAIAFHAIALTVGDSVIDEAASFGAERVILVLTDRKGRIRNRIDSGRREG
jgi:hypothetical protein